MGLHARAFAGLVFLLVVLGAALFGAAGTFDYWEAWLFLAVFGLSVSAITIDLARRDPALLARRVQAGPLAEPTASQKAIQSAASLAFLGVFVLSALDWRHGWSGFSPTLVIVGDVLVAGGLLIVFRVFRENTFTSATIAVASEQKLISSGPYALVRHPMYAGALLMMAGVPLALASTIGLLPVLVLAAVTVWRLLDEERLLAANLAGYADYCERVRYRLVPRVW